MRTNVTVSREQDLHQWLTARTNSCKAQHYLVILAASPYHSQLRPLTVPPEHPWLNRTLNFAAILRARTGFPPWERLVLPVRAISWLSGRFGKDEGGVIFEVGGVKDGKAVIHRLALMADKDGGFIPSVLAAILTDEILRGVKYPSGLVPVQQWIEPARMLADLRKRGLKIWWQETPQAAWTQLNGNAQAI